MAHISNGNKRPRIDSPTSEAAARDADSKRSLISQSRSDKMLTKMQSYFEKEELCDVVLISGDFRVPAVRAVLAACSTYFEKLFCNKDEDKTENQIDEDKTEKQMDENETVNQNEGRIKNKNDEGKAETANQEVVLEDFHPDTLYDLVKFCYSGELPLENNAVKDILASASKLEFHYAAVTCQKFLMKQLQPSNCLGLLAFAEEGNYTELQTAAEKYCQRQFTDVSEQAEFLGIDKDRLKTLLASDDLYVVSEEFVYEKLISWIKYDSANRLKHCPELLAHVRLPLLQSAYLIEFVEPVCLSSNSLECQRLLIEALKYHLFPQQQSKVISERLTPRKYFKGYILAVGWTPGTHHRGANCVKIFCLTLHDWMFWCNLPETRFGSGFAIVDESLIVVGGTIKNQQIETVYSINLQTKEVTTLSPMNQKRTHLCVAVLNNSIYAIGGRDKSVTNTVEMWDKTSGVWSYVASMSTVRHGASATVWNNHIYVAGGLDAGNYLNSMECYNPKTNTWTACAPMMHVRFMPRFVTAGNYLYIIGGRLKYNSYTETVERYDPTTNIWQTVCSLSVPREAISAVYLNNRIMAIGGYNTKSVKSIEQYEAELNVWTHIGETKAFECIEMFKCPKLKFKFE